MTRTNSAMAPMNLRRRRDMKSEHHKRHCERSEAIQLLAATLWMASSRCSSQ
jgi:hypothetical protein